VGKRRVELSTSSREKEPNRPNKIIQNPSHSINTCCSSKEKEVVARRTVEIAKIVVNEFRHFLLEKIENLRASSYILKKCSFHLQSELNYVNRVEKNYLS
jgi:hypothetical protein